ncbi:MAG TPA: TadE/TadG family type IV pilus assembly protein [Terriglobales bacterium]|nr:TadE/TadG family type IV pilus assembly protein [Terriglobales bacterium]
MRPIDSNSRRKHRHRGNELVEFALLLPALAMFLLAVGQGAEVMGTYQILCNAAREGARLSVVPGEFGNPNEIKARVVAYAAANGVTISATAVTVNQGEIVNPGAGACSATNACISASKVSVTYSYPISVLLGATINMGAAVEMRNFY